MQVVGQCGLFGNLSLQTYSATCCHVVQGREAKMADGSGPLVGCSSFDEPPLPVLLNY